MSRAIKAIPFEVKVNESKRTIEGYASTFGNKDLVGDIIQPGAFKKTISERFPRGQIKVLWQHFQPLGIPKHMEEDSKGLYVEAYISKTSLGNDAIELMRDRVVDKMSIGYETIQDEYDEASNTRFLKELKLYEFSPVTFPANEEASIGQVKTIEDFQKLLKRAQVANFSELITGEKAGRVLSDNNKSLIKNAILALQEVLDAAGEPDDEPLESGKTNRQKPQQKEFDPIIFQSILNNLKTS